MLLNYPGLKQWYTEVPRSSRVPTITGFAILFAWAGGFGYWASAAPIDGAVVASGSFVATGQNKQVQHLEGGIVRAILVREGDLVKAGQRLVRLDATASKAKLQRLRLRRTRLLAMRARLQAETKLSLKISWPRAITSRREQRSIADLMQRQQIEARARATRLGDEIKVLRKEIAGLKETIKGFKAVSQAMGRQLKLFRIELNDKRKLIGRKLVRKSDILAVQRAEARLVGELGQITSRVADALHRVARAEQQIAHLRSTAIQKAVEELRVVETELDDVEEQVRAARDVVTRVDVRAPVGGIIVKLNYNTTGGVVSPGAVILEMVPVDADLIIEARVQPSEITYLKQGQDSLVRLNGINQRVVPMIAGKVVYISADAVDERAGQSAAALSGRQFVVRVELNQAEARAKAPGFRPTPGLPAEVFIRTGQRTFFDYLLKPILDSFARAFREQ
ncbi:MAG: HlyD family type I secretion periplasmic adaptor subunit [Pseudomonadota bacterium]